MNWANVNSVASKNKIENTNKQSMFILKLKFEFDQKTKRCISIQCVSQQSNFILLQWQSGMEELQKRAKKKDEKSDRTQRQVMLPQMCMLVSIP